MAATTDHGVEIRYDHEGGLDEIVVARPKFFHLERMDDGHWWFRIDTDDGPGLAVNLSTKYGAFIEGLAEWD